MLKEIKKFNVPLMTWKKHGGNQCKLVVIYKFWLGFWENRDFGFVAN